MIDLKIGDYIYLVFRESINKVKVYMIGKESFCHDGAFNDHYLDEYRDELFMTDEGTKWFRDLKSAKEYIMRGQDPKLVEVHRVDSGYWELWEK